MKARLILCSVALAGAVATDAVSQTYGGFNEEKHELPPVSKVEFFGESGFGAVALMPNVTEMDEARSEHQHIRLREPGRYRINLDKDNWWFVLNHSDNSPELSGRHAYVGVLIAKRLDSASENRLELYRNAEWHDPSDGFWEVFDIEWEEFLALQDSTQDNFENEFGDWHAVLEPEESQSSWDRRKTWINESTTERVEECFAAVAERPEFNVFFGIRLIRFQVVEGANPRSPVAWSVLRSGVDAFYMKTFSPYTSYTGEYCIEIEE